MQRKSKKQKSFIVALCAGLVSLFLCTVVWLETTYAWMTDEQSGKVINIRAENLSVALVDAAGGNSLSGQTLVFQKVKGDGSLETPVEGMRWEPDVTYQLPAMQIENIGTLHAECTLFIESVSKIEGIGISDLVAFTITLDGTELTEDKIIVEAGKQSGNIVISAQLKKDAAEAYVGQQIGSIAIALEAKQTMP